MSSWIHDYHAVVLDELAEVDRVFSTYNESSELSIFNETLTTDPIQVSGTLHAFIQASKVLYNELGGAWDPTLAPLSRLYGFQPSRVETDTALADMGFNHIRVLDDAFIQKVVSDVSLDFSSNAKGYAIDRVLDRLLDVTTTGLFVDIGGEVGARGTKAGGEPWQVGIQSPDGRAEPVAVVPLTDACVATSGNYRQSTVVNNELVGHIFDPRSKSPVHHSFVSVSVKASSCMVADTLATGLFVMGPLKAREWLDTRLDYAAFFITVTPTGDWDFERIRF